MDDVGELLRPGGIPEGVFLERDLGQWACLYCWTPSETLAETCDARNPRTTKTCTRDPGHDGPCIACGPGAHQHPLEIWRK
jgi:hypothetical protein